MRAGQRRAAGTLIALAVAVIGVLCLLNGANRIGRPFPGFLLAHNGIVVSIGSAAWSPALDARVPFSQVLGIADTEISSPVEIQAYVETVEPGTRVSYRFRKGVDLFDASVPTRIFSRSDFLALYLNYFLVGASFAAAGLWTLWRLTPGKPGTLSFFLLCQTCALVLLAAGDVYGPYWFTSAYFAAHCFAPAALLHFGSAFPDRLGGRSTRVAVILVLYGAAAALALAINLVANSPSLFLPLIYTVNLLLANSMLLYLGRLLISRSSTADPARRRALDYALTGLVLAASLPAAILVIYPVVEGLISPLFVVAPFAFFPALTAVGLRRSAGLTAAPASVRLRLSFLFLAAVETGFLAGIGYFWLSNSWQQLLADLSLHDQQTVRLERLALNEPSAAENLVRIEHAAQSQGSRILAVHAREALQRGDRAAAAEEMQTFAAQQRAHGERLETRRMWLGRMDATLVLALVLVGVLQAVAFMIAVRRWLIQPIDELSEATSVIATGDLAYRTRVDSSAEFGALADSINSMAASLDDIQRKVEAERNERAHAAAVARDAERRRLARELHDSILQDLSAVKLAVEGEARRTEENRLAGVVGGIIEVIVSLRRVVEDLRPQELSHTTLAAAIAAQAQSLAQRHSVALDLDVKADAEVPEWAARDFYRIAQEAITNAVRHGQPRRLAVRLFRQGSDTVLEVDDDGGGFDAATVIRGGGLVGMNERADALGAKLEIRSQPGNGTAIRLSVPPDRSVRSNGTTAAHR